MCKQAAKLLVMENLTIKAKRQTKKKRYLQKQVSPAKEENKPK
jgi:hypothetical protein